ncbi:hypothetical protein [Embleya hyalina]|uniref:Scaffolding protein n=1 Tax=Embleya hyalina TaxID=516124 RepID=A0A401YHL6_9ACTN|nr:hypothetical protein [Embleya hyalina]GCD94067.1 hypothetical protein EHYA_01723 [Embleya hyalina]
MLRPRISLPPGHIVGYRADGRPIYPIAGGSGEGDSSGAAGGSGDGGQGGDAQGSATDAQGQGSEGPGAQASTKQAGADAPKPAEKPADPNTPTVGDLQAKLDAAEKRQASQMDAIAKALGLKSEDQAPSPEQLASKVTDLEATTRSQAVELAVLKRAGALGARGDRLTDSRAFLDKVGKLDPAGSNFDAQVDAAISAALKADASLAVTQPPTRSGGDFNGGPGTSGKPKNLNDAVAARLRG